MLKVNNLTFQYKNAKTSFSFPNLDLKEGENLLVLGKSGIGKTTFLHLLAGLLTPTSGEVIIDDVPIYSLSNAALDKFRGQNIGVIFQKKHAIQSLNSIENIKTRLFFSGKPNDTNKINLLLDHLNIDECKYNNVTTLSEGQLQRLSIAMAVIHEPRVILADEPTSSLDDENCKKVIDLLIQQAQLTKAILIVITHDHRVKSLFSNSITL
ncbi:ABC transporter related protein [unidentified eubacterium SCB49]|nr:ABC transporter related protein [unidentified eubacterium SCB49]